MEDLLLWYNLIFVLPFGLAVLYLLIMSFGALPFDLDVDADHDVDHDVEPGGVFKALSLLGVGRVPLSITIITLLLLWGAIGWLTNKVLEGPLQTSGAYAAISIGVALVGSLLLIGLISRVLVRVLPLNETYASSFNDLIGQVGTVLHVVDHDFGRVRVLDAHNTLIDVTCVVDKEEPAIPAGSKVLLYDYDPEAHRFLGQVYTED